MRELMLAMAFSGSLAISSDASLDAEPPSILFDEQSSVFITDDVGPNPHDRLPSYWDAEVQAVRQLNQPPAKR